MICNYKANKFENVTVLLKMSCEIFPHLEELK